MPEQANGKQFESDNDSGEDEDDACRVDIGAWGHILLSRLLDAVIVPGPIYVYTDPERGQVFIWPYIKGWDAERVIDTLKDEIPGINKGHVQRCRMMIKRPYLRDDIREYNRQKASGMFGATDAQVNEAVLAKLRELEEEVRGRQRRQR